MNLDTNCLGRKLRNRLVASAGPMTQERMGFGSVGGARGMFAVPGDDH